VGEGRSEKGQGGRERGREKRGGERKGRRGKTFITLFLATRVFGRTVNCY